jgi:hypothetical protein
MRSPYILARYRFDRRPKFPRRHRPVPVESGGILSLPSIQGVPIEAGGITSGSRGVAHEKFHPSWLLCTGQEHKKSSIILEISLQKDDLFQVLKNLNATSMNLFLGADKPCFRINHVKLKLFSTKEVAGTSQKFKKHLEFLSRPSSLQVYFERVHKTMVRQFL